LSYAPSTEIKTPSYRVFDLSFSLNYKKLAFRGGITNVFDTAPLNVGSTTGFPIGTDLGSVCGGDPNCNRPFGYSLPSTGAFSAGYYSVLGRQYYLGMNVRF
jgi:outer membrane receptor protein involved in Fe transport